MAIFKNNFHGGFSMIPNELITDLRLSAPEFRMFCYLVSRPGTWNINNTDIGKKLGIKDPHTIATYWKNLAEAKLINRIESARTDGKFQGYDYELLPYGVEPHADETTTVKNRNGKTHIHSNTDILNNNDLKNQNEKDLMSENEFSDGRDFKLFDPLTIAPEERKKVAPKKEKEEHTENWPTFQEFWDHYDKKVGKRDKLQKKWEKLPTRDKIRAMQHITLYKKSQPNKKYRMNPETYLNNDGWNNEIIFDKKPEVQQQKFSRQTTESIIKNSQGW